MESRVLNLLAISVTIFFKLPVLTIVQNELHNNQFFILQGEKSKKISVKSSNDKSEDAWEIDFVAKYLTYIFVGCAGSYLAPHTFYILGLNVTN